MLNDLHGLLLIDKPKGVTSFHVIERIQRILGERFNKKKRDLPKMGHGGTLDPFATGLLVLGVGHGVKLSRYLLESNKSYLATMKWGSTTASGDATDPIIQSGGILPSSLTEIQSAADIMASKPYLQTPPMHSAKKIDGQRLYELARKGLIVDRPAKECRLLQFQINAWDPQSQVANFSVEVTSGTFIRTLAQDLAVQMGGLAHLTELRRTQSGRFKILAAATLEALEKELDWTTLSCFVPFDEVLSSLPQAQINTHEALSLIQGKQETLYPCLKNAGLLSEKRVALYQGKKLIAVAIRDEMDWGIERVFTTSSIPNS
jgi:tRNA pseudouridine55 synthase